MERQKGARFQPSFVVDGGPVARLSGARLLRLASRASRREKHSLERFNLLLCVSPAFHTAPGREEGRSASPDVSECNVSEELHSGFLPAFKPSQKSLLFSPLSSFLNAIMNYIKKSSFVQKKSIYSILPCHHEAELQ